MDGENIQERQFDPAVGGGVDRDKLKDSDFVIPGERKFPVVKPGDVSDAVSSFGRSKGVDFDTFKRNMIALCKRKGKAFMDALPDEWKKDMNMESTAPAKAGVFVESIDLTEATFDRENRVLNNVILISAGRSKNGRQYDESVLQTAAPVFEGTKSYANHPSKADIKAGQERSIRDLTGWYTEVRFEKGALRANRHFVGTQAGIDAMAVAEAIVSGGAPSTLAGLSINAVGAGKTDKDANGEFLRVESITAAMSVDDVASPAAGGMYLAASVGDELMNAWLESMDFQQFVEARPDFVERLKKEWKTVRLEDATKQSLAEADQKVKVANDKTEEAQQTLKEAQTTVQGFDKAIAKLAEENTQLRRELVLERMLAKVKLPDLYMEDLRTRLPRTPEKDWVGMIETEQSKARRSGPPSKVPVTGAGYQEAKPPERVVTVNESLAPLPNEDVKTWMERIERLNK